MTSAVNVCGRAATGLALALWLVVLHGPTSVSAQTGTTGNPHGTLPEGLTCTSCHTTEAWTPLRPDLAFEHRRDTRFPLDGRHEDLTCEGCHAGLRFEPSTGDPGACASCHLDVHQGTLARPCASCHTTESFTAFPLGIVHPADFPLEGAHLQTSCESCHTSDLGGAYAPLDRECASCHMGDYLSTTLVDHQALGFATSCLDCHSMLDFRDVAFDHFEISGGFPLLGRHAGIECTSCHTPGGGGPATWTSDAQDCVACHLPDYQAKHGGSGYPTECLLCHNTSSWDAADFAHLAATGFELLPNHDRLDCIECHVGSSAETVFHPIGPEDCYACHQAAYQQAHASGWSTDCYACHQSTTWNGATFDHDFPIASGPHATAECADCHTTPGSYGTFSCLTCHVHAQATMDEKHLGRAGYVYESSACLSCHPDGRH